jgi:hypothetical protein
MKLLSDIPERLSRKSIVITGVVVVSQVVSGEKPLKTGGLLSIMKLPRIKSL